ncbi:ABC transporter permease [Apibacter raozihei]|uniref:ABC transporter permease n=1 Tax=Apibacter raozihei TaxID=2500547 RepID=UPI000FE39682|nr:ABC transporter permease [Apibacter raozihei]
MFKGFFSIFGSEVVRIITSPRLLFLIIGIPLGLFIYYTSLLNSGVPEKLPVVLYDQDRTQTSRQLGRMLNSSSSLNIVSEVFSYKDGEKKVRTDEALAFIIIPDDFEKNIFKGNSVSVVCYYNSQYILAGGIINKAFQTVVGTFSAGAHIKALMQKGNSSYQALAATSPVNTDKHILFNPYTNYSYYLNLSLMPMSIQIVIIVISIFSLGSVLKYDQGKELLEVGNQKIGVICMAKLLPYTIIFSIIGFFMNSLLYYKIKIPMHGNIWMINLYFIFFIIICQCVALFFVSLSTSLRAALTIGGGFAAISFSFAGYTFPEEGMPTVIKFINYCFPFTSYLRLTINYAVRGMNINIYDWKYILALIIFLILGFVSMFIYGNKLKKGGYDVK